MNYFKTIEDNLLTPSLKEGDKLYHYTSANALKGILEGEFWVTERGFLNDSMEFHVATDVFCEVLENHMNNKELCTIIQSKVRDEVVRLQTTALSVSDNHAYDGYYVISFCQDYDSPLMWSSYANYSGYCIQFDFMKLVKLFEETYKKTLMHGPVIYKHENQILLIEDTIKNSFFETENYVYLNTWEDFDKLTIDNLNDWLLFMAILLVILNMFFKLPCFEGEHEYRFVFMVGHDGGYFKKEQLWKQYFRVKDEVLIPYIKVPLTSLDAVERIKKKEKNKSDIAVKGIQYLCRNLKHDTIVEKSKVPLRY